MSDYESALQLARKSPDEAGAILARLHKAIADGDARAEYALATWHLHGKNVPLDMAKGTELLKRAAAKGEPNALFDLAALFENGTGVRKNLKRAFALYREAAEKGDAGSMHEVGRMLYYGLGTAEDRVAADAWLQRFEDAKTAKSREEAAVV